MKKTALILFFLLALNLVFAANTEPEFKPVLIKPPPFPEGALEKGNTHKILVYFIDSFNQLISTERVTVHSASIKKQEIELQADKERESFKGEFDSNYFFNSREELKIEATSTGYSRKEFTLPIYFKPLKISAENPFKGKKFYLNSQIKRIEFSLSLPDGIMLEKGNFTALLFSGEKKIEEKDLFFENGKWITDLNYRVTAGDFENGLKLKLSGKDPYENELKESFAVPLKQENPLFYISLKEPVMDSIDCGYLQPVEFIIKVNSTKSEELKNVRAWIESRDLGIKKDLVREGEFFKTIVEMPKKGNSLNISVFGSAELGKKKLHSFKEIRVNLSSEIIIEFVYPRKGKTTKASNKLKARLSYPYKNQGLKLKEVQAFLFIDGEKYEVTLSKNKETGLYYANSPLSLIGKHTLTLKLKEPFSGKTTIHTEITKPIDWWNVLVIVLGLVFIGFLVFNFVHGKKTKIEEKGKLKKRLNEIEKETKKAESDYYKRKLNDTQYRQKILELQQEKEQILKKIKK